MAVYQIILLYMLKVVNKDIFILYIEIHRNKDIIFETTF